MAEFGQRFYEDDEAEQILRLAASLSSPFGAMSREKLLETAAELGITPEAVEMAEKQLAGKRTAMAERTEFDAGKRREFTAHLVSFVIVNGFLIVINEITTPGGYFWAIWPILGWGMGLLFHAAETFLKGSENYREEFEKWQSKRTRKAVRDSPDHDVIGNSDFVIDKYVHKRLDRGRDVSKSEAIQYLQEKTDLDSRSAREAVEQYINRNPGLLD